MKVRIFRLGGKTEVKAAGDDDNRHVFKLIVQFFDAEMYGLYVDIWKAKEN